jgi:hypothetical protein
MQNSKTYITVYKTPGTFTTLTLPQNNSLNINHINVNTRIQCKRVTNA